MVGPILTQYGLNIGEYAVQQFHSGLINKTWKVSTASKSYILQKINDHVFKHPEDIDQNLRKLNSYLNTHFPDYLFVAPLASYEGATIVQTDDGCFRLLPFVEGSQTIDSARTSGEAFEAAKQFGKFSRLLSGFNADELAYTLPDFHNLSVRFDQFLTACTDGSPERLGKAAEAIAFIKKNDHIVGIYDQIRKDQSIPHRVIHHDTKISNVLFDAGNKGMCVIDLDTVMPGYFFSATGDMMRTYLSHANEEETDLGKIDIRTDFFKAIYNGYLSEMGPHLTEAEKELFIYSGEFIIYM
ncbi:MAG TPA: aminoglycoside phosphotransferase family protein, partial [Daejeonella sp.]|nr:aminoglycoside phosphotransferase family protein [Daejeonella sp.]